MLLCDRDLKLAVDGGWLGVHPYEPELVQPSSIDVRLDEQLLAWPPGDTAIDPSRPQKMLSVTMREEDHYLLRPGRMVLGSTMERITVADDLACRVEGKSSLGRLGLAVHVTAGFIDPGFDGHVTLEIVNHAPRAIVLRPGMRIGQLCVFELSGKAERPYGADGVGHYQGQRGPTPSRSHIGWRTWPTAPAPAPAAKVTGRD
ncbi:dCTP deaminase [Rhizomonospora bruguierae]|uniref:dCTP deaminase n=1 Tax=Rhizomonospora bruguierae TaxID=1581705 RepID=UPI001BD0A1BE|nr:dCTP deaminase [Micromonospora sp. NBRC 107566]